MIARTSLLVWIWASAAGLAQVGPVAHYTFDEGQGAVARDVSGNGHDGKIVGAQFAESPRGHALRFDGKDDYVDLGRPASLNLTGDLSLMMWIKPTDLTGRNRMLFGDAASRTIHRNFNLRISKGRLWFEHANDTQYGFVIGEKELVKDQWRHIALVCEHPRYYLYRNGRKLRTGPLNMPMQPTQGGHRRIGGWFAGWFKGDIDEVVLYNRALADREVATHFKGSAQESPEPEAHLQLRMHRSNGTVTLSCLCANAPGDPGRVECAVLPAGNKEPLQRIVVPARLTRPGAERWQAEVVLSTKDLPDGRYDLRATFLTQDGRVLAAASQPIEHKAGLPRWFGSKEGVSTAVLPPFTPLEVDGADEHVNVRPWGRTYAFGPAPFMEQIVSRDAKTLAAPMGLVAHADGRAIEWPKGRPTCVTASASVATIEQRARGSALGLRLKTTIEFDGLVRFDWSVHAERAATLTGLAMDVPVKSAHAKYLYTWRKTRSGALKGDFACKFRPIVWLGDEDRGLQWLCESQQNWNPANPKRAIEVTQHDGISTLRLNIIGKPTRLEAGQELSYTFAFMATPMKPMDKDVWDYRIFRNRWYGYSMKIHEKEIAGKPALQHYRDVGARAMLILRWWRPFAYPWPLGYEDDARRLMDALHRHGLRGVPYTGGFLMSELAPEAEAFKDDMAVKPDIPYPLMMPGLPGQMAFIACPRSCWQDFLVDGVARMVDEFGIDGVYLDSTTRSLPCTNTAHGCGYRKPDGTIGPTYPVFATRRLIRRLYTAIRQRKPDGIVDVHVYDAMHAPALAFATSYWNGEQLRRGAKFKTDALPLDRFRTEFMGYNWGVPADLLYYVMGECRKCWALTIIHDVPVRTERTQDMAIHAGLWDLRERFGVKRAQWLPYWNNAKYVEVSPKDCYASLFRHPKNGLLAYVSNLSRADGQVEVVLNPGALGIEPPLQAADGLTGERIPLDGATLRLKLASQDWRAVWVRAGAGR